MASGELFVTTFGMTEMQVLCANNLGSHHKACLITDAFCTHNIYLMYTKSIGAVATRYQLTESNLIIAINDLNCTGSEERVVDCPHNALGTRNCYHREDASVVCQLLDGKTEF